MRLGPAMLRAAGAAAAAKVPACDLTGLDVANASLTDEAISTAEAMRLTFKSVPATDDGNPSAVLTFVCSPDLHLVQTRADDGLGLRILEADRRQATGLGPGASPPAACCCSATTGAAARTPSALLRMRQARSWS